MSANNITQKVQIALRDWLKTQTLGDILAANVYSGISWGNLTDEQGTPLPCIVCQCESANAEEPFTGNWEASAEIWVKSQSNDTTESAHLTRASVVFDLLMQDGIESSISTALADFTARLIFATHQGYELTRSGLWKSHLSLTIRCCGSDLS